MEVRDAAELLEAAAREIERCGHWKGSYAPTTLAANHDLPVCAMGALSRACTGDAWGLFRHPTDRPPEPRPWQANRAIAALAEVVGYHAIPTWNDLPERTAAEVTAAMRTAAAIFRLSQRQPQPELEVA